MITVIGFLSSSLTLSRSQYVCMCVCVVFLNCLSFRSHRIKQHLIWIESLRWCLCLAKICRRKKSWSFRSSATLPAHTHNYLFIQHTKINSLVSVSGSLSCFQFNDDDSNWFYTKCEIHHKNVYSFLCLANLLLLPLPLLLRLRQQLWKKPYIKHINSL